MWVQPFRQADFWIVSRVDTVSSRARRGLTSIISPWLHFDFTHWNRVGVPVKMSGSQRLTLESDAILRVSETIPDTENESIQLWHNPLRWSLQPARALV